MNAEELLQKIIAYGGDEAGIRDRFGENVALYEACFLEFLEEPSFQILEAAMQEKDYPQAFNAAHALKGLSGNLGITGFYEAICTLVESLRAAQYEDVAAEYAAVCHAYKQLCHIETAQPECNVCSAPEVYPDTDESNRRAQPLEDGVERVQKRNLILVIAAIVAALLLIAYAFCRISANYQKNVTVESGRHLVEMSYEIRLYVEEQVNNDWRVASSIGDSICNNDAADDATIRKLLHRKIAIWDISDVMLYTDDGYCIYANGQTEMNDIASEMIVRARDRGKYLSVLDSNLIYTIPLETDRQYNGARIVAISVVQNMETFLDDMHFSSFDGQAWLYLTEENGIVISRLTNPAAVRTFNFKSLMDGKTVTPISDNAYETDAFLSREAAAYMAADTTGKNYVVSVPVDTGDTPLRIFYLAPDAVVNGKMNAFSSQLTSFSLLMIFLFGVFAFALFLLLYRNRKQRFDKELLTREHMYDLLVQNTRTAFALFSVGKPEPVYISRNASRVIGEALRTVEKTKDGYRIRGSENPESATICRANEMLRGWDGKHVFKSEYIENDMAVPPYWFEFQLYPVEGARGEDFICIAQDVTQAYAREEATKTAMELATRANEAKSRFLSNMSHDIRTPMNAIMNMTNFALESIDQPKKLGAYLRTIHEASEHLLLLINEVLDMNRIESGRIELASEPLDIRTEIGRQVDMVRSMCEGKQLTLITDFSGLGTTMVYGDALKISQIVINLLSNAIKFTPEKGAVRFTATDIPSISDDIVDVRFSVEDNGIGIAKADIAGIFEPFIRADDKRVGKIEGTGLGLAICKNYVDAMGGTIRCESEEGEGSTFIVDLFFTKVQTEPKDGLVSDMHTGEAPFLGMHCLVLEDNCTNQLIAKALLERMGFIVDIADDGREGVEMFLSAKPGTYDVIYMDIRMPVMDGYEATMRIRESGHPQADTIPIVAMTANAYTEDVEKARLVGMDAYIGKPIVTFDLIEQTEQAIRKKRR